MKLVLDASVIIKWFATDEEFSESALLLLSKIRSGEVLLTQPVHWKAEVIAVLSRLRVNEVDQFIPLLRELESEVFDDADIYQLASEISIRLNHHLFDTLYHAVALDQDIVLITDDRKYFRKAATLGKICLLQDVDVLFPDG